MACQLCRRRRAAEREAVAAGQRAFAGRPLRLLPEAEEEPRGLAALRRIGVALADPARGGVLGTGAASPRLVGEADRASAHEEGQGARPGGLPRGGAGPAWAECLGAHRLVLFGGKGGVGKTTCAAAAALTIAARWPNEPLLLVSTDPAHSLGDVLAAPLGDEERQVPGAPPNLWVRELDAPAALARWRGGHRAMLGGVLAGLTGDLRGEGGAAARRGGRRRAGAAEAEATGEEEGAAAPQGEAAGDLLELVPTGLDELVGVLALADALLGEEGGGAARRAPVEPAPPRRGEPAGNRPAGARVRRRRQDRGVAGRYARVVVDTAPTGHALRLMAMPELALAWDHALLSILLKYREVAPPGDLAAELVSLSRRLKRFLALLRDPGACRFVAVARAAELPYQETARMMTALGELGIEVGSLLVNAVTPPADRTRGGPGDHCARCASRVAAEAPHLAMLAALAERAQPAGRAAARGAEGCAMILAPAEFPPPRGARRLGEWGQSWKAGWS